MSIISQAINALSNSGLGKKVANAFKPVDVLNASYVPGSVGTVDPITQVFNSSSKSPNPYAYYLDIISQWPTAPALASMWLIVFDLQSVAALKNDPGSQVSYLDSEDFQPWEISASTVTDLIGTDYQQNTNNLVGCVFAQEVNIPGETISAVQPDLKWGGLQTPYVIQNRSGFEKLKITFLETNASFADLVIRPWIVLAGHYGLIARDPSSIKNVKCSFMDVIQFAKTSPTKSATIRKIVRYYDVVPVSLESVQLSQAEEGLKRRSTTFIYNGYSVMESGSLNQIAGG